MGGGVSKGADVEEEKTPEERKAEIINLVTELSSDPEKKEDEESFYCAISQQLMVDPESIGKRDILCKILPSKRLWLMLIAKKNLIRRRKNLRLFWLKAKCQIYDRPSDL